MTANIYWEFTMFQPYLSHLPWNCLSNKTKLLELNPDTMMFPPATSYSHCLECPLHFQLPFPRIIPSGIFQVPREFD